MDYVELCGHYLNPDFSDSFLSAQEKKVNIDLPHPIHKPFRNQEVDIIRKYNEDVTLHHNRLLELDKDFGSVKDKIMQQRFEINSTVNIPKNVIDFYQAKKIKQPFLCDYNPFYTAGLLEHFVINNTDYLIRPSATNILRVSKVSKPSKGRKLIVDSSVSDITGISTALQHDYEVLLLLQHLNEVNLIQLTDITEAQILWNQKFKREVLSSKYISSNVGVVLSNLKFVLYDIETNTKLEIKKNDDKVICFDFIDNNNIALLSEKSLKILDRRSNEYTLYKPELDSCSSLCSLKSDNNLLYLGATHQLFKTDTRYSKPFDFCTHMMESSPCYMDFLQTDNQKYLCLSSQSANEKVLFYGDSISSLPLSVPSLNDTLSECRLQKDILLKKHLDERLSKSTGGIKLLSENDVVYLYTTNCMGEIFKQKISNLTQNTSDAIESLYNWINKLPEPQKKLHLTHAENLSGARFALHKPINEEELHIFKKSGRKLEMFLNRDHYNTNDLSDLAANFASIWDVEDRKEKDDVNAMPEDEPIDKVSKWIDSNYFDMDG